MRIIAVEMEFAITDLVCVTKDGMGQTVLERFARITAQGMAIVISDYVSVGQDSRERTVQ